MIEANDLPATMPGSMKEQLIALAPFMTDRTFKMNGGFTIDMKIPIESFLTFNINHAELAAHNMSLSVQVEQPEPDLMGMGACGLIRNRPKFADVQLTYL